MSQHLVDSILKQPHHVAHLFTTLQKRMSSEVDTLGASGKDIIPDLSTIRDIPVDIAIPWLETRSSMPAEEIATAKGKGTYDAVLSLFHVMSYQVESFQLLQVFQNAINHLDIGGMFIFDFWYSPAVCEQRPSIKVKRIHDAEISITRLAEPKISSLENRVDVNYTIFVEDKKTGELTYFKENHPMRHFTLPELDLIAEGVGFRRLLAEEFGSGNVPNESTWGVCVAFERIK